MTSGEGAMAPQPLPAPDLHGLRADLLRWWEQAGRDFPWRRAADPYAIFLAEFVLQKTQVAKAEQAYTRLITTYPNVNALAQADERDLIEVFSWLGLTKRAGYLRASAAIISGKHGGQFPRDASKLLELPGVGQYTAHAILCFGFGEALPVVDSTTSRVVQRVLGFRTSKQAWEDKVTWAQAAELLNPDQPVEHNYALIDLAALVCLPSQPKCPECPLRNRCVYGLTQAHGGNASSED